MNKKQWYEVFCERHSNDSGEGETQTVIICETLEEARREKKEREAIYYIPHYIDKWEDTGSPQIIRSIA